MRQKYKKKNRSRRPPLSLLDKCIYWAGLMLSMLLTLLLIFCYEGITNAIAFRDPRVVAYNSHASFLLVMPLLLYLEMKDGKSFAFSNRDFDRSKTNCKEMCLEKMIEIKSYYAMDSITIKGAHNIREAVDYLGMNAEQMQLLQELFQ